MTTVPLSVARVRTTPQAKPIFYLRAVVALAMVGAWITSGVSGIVIWLAPDGRGADGLALMFGGTKHAWTDVHVASSFLAIALTLTHLAVMRRGVLAYARLLLTGRRSASKPSRRPKPVVFARATVVVTILIVVPVVILSGVVPWLAADGRRSGQQLLLLAVTKRGWADIHTAISMLAMGIAGAHVLLVRAGLVTDLRLLATGQRSAPRRVARAAGLDEPGCSRS